MADFKQSREVYVEQKYAKKEAADIDVGPRKPFGKLTVKLDVDASDAIRALKALQREARKATQALRELEAELHKCEVVIPKKTTEEMLREWRELVEQVTKPPTNITINIPEIKANNKADVEKIAKELTRKLDELND